MDGWAGTRVAMQSEWFAPRETARSMESPSRGETTQTRRKPLGIRLGTHAPSETGTHAPESDCNMHPARITAHGIPWWNSPGTSAHTVTDGP